MHRYRWLGLTWTGMREGTPALLISSSLLGILILGIFVNLISNLLSGNTEGLLWTVLLLLGLVSVATLLVTAYYESGDQRVQLNETSEIPKKRVVVSALSPYRKPCEGKPENLGVLPLVIKTHQETLEVIHLISVLKESDEGDVYVTHEGEDESRNGVKTAYNKLKEKGVFQDIEVVFHPIKNINSAEDSFEATSEVLDKLSPDEVIVDVTAGRKAMSVGMSAAAFAQNCPLSYLATPRDQQGEPIFGETLPVVLENGKLRTRILRRIYTAEKD